MRLSEHQRRIIREVGLKHFGVVPRVFGSRVDDSRRGGDIDLYIDKPMDAALAYQCETRLWVELRKRLGEHVLRSFVVEVLDKPMEDKPMLDLLNRLERLGYLSTDDWLATRLLRNQLTHDFRQDHDANIAGPDSVAQVVITPDKRAR